MDSTAPTEVAARELLHRLIDEGTVDADVFSEALADTITALDTAVEAERERCAGIADKVAQESTRTSEESWNEGQHDTARVYMGWSNGAQKVASEIRALPEKGK